VLELLALLLPILSESDPPLHAHIQASSVQPFFALSCFITWFAHNLQQLPHAARVFDLFVASHPLMPLYATAAVLMVRALPVHIAVCCSTAALCEVGQAPHLLSHGPC
jgi:hypothetical protein